MRMETLVLLAGRDEYESAGGFTGGMVWVIIIAAILLWGGNGKKKDK